MGALGNDIQVCLPDARKKNEQITVTGVLPQVDGYAI
jgi:hypothetical protein